MKTYDKLLVCRDFGYLKLLVVQRFFDKLEAYRALRCRMQVQIEFVFYETILPVVRKTFIPAERVPQIFKSGQQKFCWKNRLIADVS